jgi:hypothetical protein
MDFSERRVIMPDAASREPARDPQDLERLLVIRQHAGDVEGMMALYELQAVVDCGEGRLLRGTDAIRAYFAGVVATGRTSTRLPDGTVTAESLPRTTIRGRPPPGRRHLALDHRQVLQRLSRADAGEQARARASGCRASTARIGPT